MTKTIKGGRVGLDVTDYPLYVRVVDAGWGNRFLVSSGSISLLILEGGSKYL